MRIYALAVIVSLIASAWAAEGEDDEEDFLDWTGNFFHLAEDPYENFNLYNSSEHRHTMKYVKKLTDEWAAAVLPAQKPEEGDKKTLWMATNASIPWLTTDFEPPVIVNKYSYDKAPHIVFALVDDWGYNDVGFRSTYMKWTTPTIDKLASEGVILENYWTMYSCIPARGALLTGRFAARLGVWQSGEGAELPLGEITLAQEMKSAGYRTYMVGKWHLGYSTWQHTPTMRGFDSFYGYYNGHIDYWNKGYGRFLDLHDNKRVVENPEELDENLHTGHLFQSKVEDVIEKHAENYPDEPMFLYYSMQLIHGVWSAPKSYLERCGMPSTADLDDYSDNVEYNYCGLNVMLDEAIANLTCSLEKNNMADNTYLIIVSDNGGEKMNPGNSYPWRGQKGAYYKGGMFGTAIIHSKLLPGASQGMKYNGLVHVTDWFPTLMGLATGGAWSGSYHEAEIDGVDVWHSVLTNSESPKKVIVHYHDGQDMTSVQFESYKLNIGDAVPDVASPAWIFEEDLVPENSRYSCDAPSLVNPSSGAMKSSRDNEGSDTSYSSSGTHSDELSFMDFLGVGVLGILCAMTISMSMRLAYTIQTSNSNPSQYLPKIFQRKEDHMQSHQSYRDTGLYKDIDGLEEDASESSNLI